MDEIHVHKTKKSICAHFAESPCKTITLSECLTVLIMYRESCLGTFSNLLSYF